MNAPNFSKPEHDTSVKINWLSFNIPTLALLFGTLWWYATDRGEIKGDIEELKLTIEANQNAMQLKIDAINSANVAWQAAMDRSREATLESYDSRLAPLLDNNLPIRVTMVETAVDKYKQTTDERIDRVSSAMGALRDNTAETNTKLALQAQQLESLINRFDRAFPDSAPMSRR